MIIHKSFEATRYILYFISYIGVSYIIVGIHLPANPHCSPDDRKAVISELMMDLTRFENDTKVDNTIIIGDFNSSPFDSELVQKNMFNAVLFKKLIMEQEKIKYNNHFYKRFYNPMLDYISESNEHYGSYYYTSSIDALVWYCYDQVLLRKPLVNSIIDLSYCKKIMKESLITSNGIPKKNISDHLPLVMEVE